MLSGRCVTAGLDGSGEATGELFGEGVEDTMSKCCNITACEVVFEELRTWKEEEGSYLYMEPIAAKDGG